MPIDPAIAALTPGCGPARPAAPRFGPVATLAVAERGPGADAAVREARYLLQGFEAWALPRLARRLPASVLPDHLTWLALAAALGIGLCYAGSGAHPGLLWLASGLWLLHWFGDSLDGTLARVRHIERPRYGYYIDHSVDMIAAAAIFLGLGASPYMAMPLALATLAAYYLLSINVFLEAQVLKRFRAGYEGVGPTEARLLAIFAGTALALGVRPVVMIAGLRLAALDLVVIPLVLVALVVLARRFRANLRHLAALEPAGVVRDDGAGSEASIAAPRAANQSQRPGS